MAFDIRNFKNIQLKKSSNFIVYLNNVLTDISHLIYSVKMLPDNMLVIECYCDEKNAFMSLNNNCESISLFIGTDGPQIKFFDLKMEDFSLVDEISWEKLNKIQCMKFIFKYKSKMLSF